MQKSMAHSFMTHCDWGSLNNLPKVTCGVDIAEVFVDVIDSTEHTHTHTHTNVYVCKKQKQQQKKNHTAVGQKMKVSDSIGREGL